MEKYISYKNQINAQPYLYFKAQPLRIERLQARENKIKQIYHNLSCGNQIRGLGDGLGTTD